MGDDYIASNTDSWAEDLKYKVKHKIIEIKDTKREAIDVS